MNDRTWAEILVGTIVALICISYLSRDTQVESILAKYVTEQKFIYKGKLYIVQEAEISPDARELKVSYPVVTVTEQVPVKGDTEVKVVTSRIEVPVKHETVAPKLVDDASVLALDVEQAYFGTYGDKWSAETASLAEFIANNLVKAAMASNTAESLEKFLEKTKPPESYKFIFQRFRPRLKTANDIEWFVEGLHRCIRKAEVDILRNKETVAPKLPSKEEDRPLATEN